MPANLKGPKVMQTLKPTLIALRANLAATLKGSVIDEDSETLELLEGAITAYLGVARDEADLIDLGIARDDYAGPDAGFEAYLVARAIKALAVVAAR